MSTPEGRVKAKVDRLLNGYGEKVWFFKPQAGPFGRAGIPDFVGCCLGFMFTIECKADAQCEPTKLQEKCMDDIDLAGGVTFLVYDDATLKKVRSYLDQLLAVG